MLYVSARNVNKVRWRRTEPSDRTRLAPKATNLINTGLEAGAARRYTPSAVLTASLIVPMQLVTIDEFLEFLCERSHAVVFFLVGDVTRYQIHIGM